MSLNLQVKKIKLLSCLSYYHHMALRGKINDGIHLYELLGKREIQFLNLVTFLWLSLRWHHGHPTVIIWIHLVLPWLWWPQQGQPQATAGETAAASASAASILDLVPLVVASILQDRAVSNFQNKHEALQQNLWQQQKEHLRVEVTGSDFSRGLSRIPMENG